MTKQYEYFRINDIVPSKKGDGIYVFKVTDVVHDNMVTWEVDIGRSAVRLFAPGYFYKCEMYRNTSGMYEVKNETVYASKDSCILGKWNTALHGHELNEVSQQPHNTMNYFEPTEIDWRKRK